MDIRTEVTVIVNRQDLEQILRDYFRKKKIEIRYFGLDEVEYFSIKGVQYDTEAEVNYNRGYDPVTWSYIEP